MGTVSYKKQAKSSLREKSEYLVSDGARDGRKSLNLWNLVGFPYAKAAAEAAAKPVI
jgi:hypothetical protein